MRMLFKQREYIEGVLFSDDIQGHSIQVVVSTSYF
jgi:hypothetical protein